MSFKFEKPLYKTYKHNKKRKPTKVAKAKLEQTKPSAVTTIPKPMHKYYAPTFKPNRRKSFSDTSPIELPKESPVSDTEKRRLARKTAQESEARKDAARQRRIDAEYQASISAHL